jgi:hypothetical protein
MSRFESDLRSCFATLLSPKAYFPDFLMVSLSYGLGLREKVYGVQGLPSV